MKGVNPREQKRGPACSRGTGGVKEEQAAPLARVWPSPRATLGQVAGRAGLLGNLVII